VEVWTDKIRLQFECNLITFGKKPVTVDEKRAISRLLMLLAIQISGTPSVSWTARILK
jgi:hypothetical protein